MTVAIAILLLIAIILTVVFVLWGGFLLVISGGDEHKVSPAINMIRYSAIGLLLMFVIILVIPALSSAVGFEAVGQKFKPNTIFRTMTCVANRVFGKTDESCFNVASEGSTTGVNLQFSNTDTTTGNSPNGGGAWTQNL
jgi:hypothetical protein